MSEDCQDCVCSAPANDELAERKRELEVKKLEAEVARIDVEGEIRRREVNDEKALLELERARVELARTELDHDYAKRQHADLVSKASQAAIYTFYGPVTKDSVARCMEELGNWARREPGCNITLIFNSPGGSIIDGLALFDFIQELRVKGHYIETVALGMAASMGGILLQAGDKRVVGKNAMVLIHEASMGTGGKTSEIEDEVAFVKRLQEKLLDILAERSTMTKTSIKRKWMRKDWWLDSEESIKLGFADEIR